MELLVLQPCTCTPASRFTPSHDPNSKTISATPSTRAMPFYPCKRLLQQSIERLELAEMRLVTLPAISTRLIGSFLDRHGIDNIPRLGSQFNHSAFDFDVGESPSRPRSMLHAAGETCHKPKGNLPICIQVQCRREGAGRIGDVGIG